MTPTLLLIDDEPSIQHAFARAFRGPDVVLRSALTAAEGLAEVARLRPDVVVLDVHLPDASGLDTFRKIRQIDARIPVILITGHGTTDLAIEAMSDGAFEYLLKPLELADLRALIDQALRAGRLMIEPAAMPEVEVAPPEGDRLVGACAAMQEVYKSVGRVAKQDVTVLITGESGTGKELVARAIYQHSRRADKPFLAINCAAIPEALLESELFGHEKGAFTGADRRRVGKFEQCHGGTIFLDEVGEMTPLTQSKFLRLVQEQRFERVGGNETIQTDVRLIAATNVDLAAMSEEGRFRKDLYFRLNVYKLHLPALRERNGDLPSLLEHFTGRFARELGKPVPMISLEARTLLEAYPWPGNVRELQSVLKRSLLRMSGSVLLADFLPDEVRNKANVAPPAGERFDWDAFVADRIEAGSEELYAESIERMEREVLMRVLRHTNGNQLQAAKILGITRGSLRTKLRAHAIIVGRSVWSDDEHADA